ncbi:MAG: RNA methyltransferase [Muribaculaceae bacterium]|nr:RNA methyltransferase [Muribaculaceae bacterium]
MDNKSFQMVAKTFQGLEEVLRDELIALGAQNVETGTRMVSFEGDLELMYKANLCCRTALRILKPIAKFSASDTDELYDFVRDFKWEDYMTAKSTFCVDSTVNSPGFPHSKYVTYRVKDGIVDHFRDTCGERPSIRLEKADVQLNVHIADTRVTISLDSSGEPLNRRGYRVEQTEAPINEVLAAGIIMLTGWHGETDFADPMCGSGTFPIEAALIAGNINPGIYREGFAFEKWPDFDSELFETLYNDDEGERDITCRILCGDKDPEAVRIARRNIKAARLESNINIVCRPMQEWDENENPGGILVTNPPYGERIRPADMDILYRQLGETLKFHFQGWNAWILGYKDEHFASIGLKPSVKYPILNGALECSLREYVLFEGKYNDFRADGGSVKNHSREETPRNNRHYKSEREWEQETRPYKKKFTRDRRREDYPDFDNRGEYRPAGKSFTHRKSGDAPGQYRGSSSPARKVTDKGPRLSESSTAFSSPVFMRTRKSRFSKREDKETNE